MPELVEMVKATRHFETSAANYQLPNDTMTQSRKPEISITTLCKPHFQHLPCLLWRIQVLPWQLYRWEALCKRLGINKKIFTGTFYCVV